jgi:fucose permease
MYEEERAKKLNMLNFYYSIGAVAGPFIAGSLSTLLIML